MGLKAYLVTSQLVRDCILALCKLAAMDTVMEPWTAREEGNENADELIKEGVLPPFYGLDQPVVLATREKTRAG